MKKIILYSLIGVFAVISLNGCLPKDHNTYEGPTQVEFKNQTFGINTAVLNTRGIVTSPATQVQTVKSRTILINTRVVDTIYVQLVGPQSSSPITVNFTPGTPVATTVSGGITTSAAVEGVNYNFRPAGARTLTIPANSSVGYLLIDVIPNSIATPTTDLRALPIVLLGGSNGITPSPNYSNFTVTFKR